MRNALVSLLPNDLAGHLQVGQGFIERSSQRSIADLIDEWAQLLDHEIVTSLSRRRRIKQPRDREVGIIQNRVLDDSSGPGRTPIQYLEPSL